MKRDPGERRARATTPTRWRRIQEVFSAAVEAGEGAAALVDRECAEDPELAREVLSLLSAHAEEGAADLLDRELADHTRAEGPAAGERLGRYRILERLGSGGMGVVYAARDDRLDRTVALKVLPSVLSLDGDASRRFLLEAQSAAALDHPNICAIHEVAESEDGRLFIAMPLYRGEPLDVRLRRAPLPVEDALEIAVAVARGLAHAHERGIVHRDVKPANLFLTEEGSVRILDFGIAKVADANLTHSGAILGTFPYMSPEQARGSEIDPRTDLWALGVVLYEMIAGARPFQGPNHEATIAAILTREPPPLAGPPEVQPAAEVVRRLLAKDPDGRPPNASALVEALEGALHAVRHGPVWEGAGAGPPISADGERRQVAVMVARVGGYAEIVEGTAPEALEAAVGRIRAAATEAASRHGGVVHRFSGESLVCLFGVPWTHEDDVARAVRAARELLSWAAGPWLGEAERTPDLGLSAGISAGVVVVQPDPSSRSHRVAGDPLERAARLAALAEPGRLWAGPECRRPLAPLFELEDGPAIPLGGPGDPSVPFTVVGEAEGAMALETASTTRLAPFAGRERELAVLDEALQLALAGEGQLVSVEGEAGSGKSRLLVEWNPAGRAGAPEVVRVWCGTHRLGAPPYLPFVAVLRELLDRGGGSADELDAEGAARRFVEERAPELEGSLPLVLHLLGGTSDRHPLPRHLEGERLRTAIRDTLAALLTLSTRTRPLALVLEDWHWADDASREVLGQLAELVPAYRLLLVVSYRPGHGVEWPASTPRRGVVLGPLSAEATGFLVRAVLGADEVPEDLAASIHRRAGGNPFFVEELCLALKEQGAATVKEGRAELAGQLEALHLPPTIQGVIRSRLDRLEPTAREVARAASVVGRDFTLSLLDGLVGPDASLPHAVDRLRQAGLIHQTGLVPEPAYRFKHLLTQEVIYDTLLAHRRRALHAQVGRALEALHADRSGQVADVLAFHFSRAEAWREAVRYGKEEARNAHALSEFARALGVAERVEEWVQKFPEGPERRSALVDILLEQERLCETLGRRQTQEEILSRLLELLDPERDRRELSEVHRRRGDLYGLLKDFGEGEAALSRALSLAREVEDPELERSAVTSLGLLRLHTGRAREALPQIERALAISRERGAPHEIARDLYNLSIVLRSVGEGDRGLHALEEARPMAEAADDPAFVAYVHYSLGLLLRSRGDRGRALENLERAVELDRAHGLLTELQWALPALANLELEEGRVEEALEGYREAVEIGRRTGHAEGLAQTLRSLGDILLGLGRNAEALPRFYDAVELLARLEDRDEEAELWTRIASLEEERKEPRAAADAWRRVRELRRDAADLPKELEAAAQGARALRDAEAEPEEVREAFRDALALAASLEDRAAEARLRNAAGIFEWRVGGYEEALVHYERSLELFRALGEPATEGLALNSIGATLLCLGRVEDARRRLEHAVAVNRASGQALLEGHALGILGDALLASGRADEAQRRYESSLDIRRRIGDRRGEGWMLHHLARSADQRGDHRRAHALRHDARRIAREIGDDELTRVLDLAPAGDPEPSPEPWRPEGSDHA